MTRQKWETEEELTTEQIIDGLKRLTEEMEKMLSNSGKRLTKQQTIEKLLRVTDGYKWVFSNSGSGLTAIEGEEDNWEWCRKVGGQLRSKLRHQEARKTS